MIWIVIIINKNNSSNRNNRININLHNKILYKFNKISRII